MLTNRSKELSRLGLLYNGIQSGDTNLTYSKSSTHFKPVSNEERLQNLMSEPKVVMNIGTAVAHHDKTHSITHEAEMKPQMQTQSTFER